MLQHIFERAGVMLDVRYTVGADGVTEFDDVRVLGEDYKPVGPNLVHMLDSTFFITNPAPPVMQAEAFLSAIAADIA